MESPVISALALSAGTATAESLAISTRLESVAEWDAQFMQQSPIDVAPVLCGRDILVFWDEDECYGSGQSSLVGFERLPHNLLAVRSRNAAQIGKLVRTREQAVWAG
jgi:hypothetical protein